MVLEGLRGWASRHTREGGCAAIDDIGKQAADRTKSAHKHTPPCANRVAIRRQKSNQETLVELAPRGMVPPSLGSSIVQSLRVTRLTRLQTLDRFVHEIAISTVLAGLAIKSKFEKG